MALARAVELWQSETGGPRRVQDSQYRLAVEGLGALDNVDGDVIAQELGIDMGNKDRNVIVVIGWAGGLFAALIVVSIIKPHVSAAVRGVSSALHSVLAR